MLWYMNYKWTVRHWPSEKKMEPRTKEKQRWQAGTMTPKEQERRRQGPAGRLGVFFSDMSCTLWTQEFSWHSFNHHSFSLDHFKWISVLLCRDPDQSMDACRTLWQKLGCAAKWAGWPLWHFGQNCRWCSLGCETVPLINCHFSDILVSFLKLSGF